MTALPHAHDIRRKAAIRPAPDDTITLGYEARMLRRKRLVSDGELAFIVDLAETVSLDEGDCFILRDGRQIEIRAASEPVLAITGDLARLAWHIGNRHTPCQIGPDRLLIREDHVLEAMLRQLGLSELVAKDRDEYVRLALDLGRNADRRRGIQATIGERAGALFGDRAPTAAFAQALVALAGRGD